MLIECSRLNSRTDQELIDHLMDCGFLYSVMREEAKNLIDERGNEVMLFPVDGWVYILKSSSGGCLGSAITYKQNHYARDRTLHVWIHEEFRRQGFGTRLIEHVKRVEKQSYFKVDKHDHQAERFYDEVL
jgi:GNAT superfamily N-acetyltransferase